MVGEIIFYDHAGAYELVVFQLKPGYLSQFAHRVVQGLPDRLAMDYSHPLGFWYTEFGQSSQQGIYLLVTVHRRTNAIVIIILHVYSGTPPPHSYKDTPEIRAPL